MRVLLALCVLAFCACAHESNPEERHRKVRRYDGPVIDIHAHVLPNASPAQEEAWSKNAADPHVTRLGAVVIATPGAARELNDDVINRAKADPKISRSPRSSRAKRTQTARSIGPSKPARK